MAAFFDHIPDKYQDFIKQQAIFFVSTAPLSAEGHVNLSPKGLDCFRILSPNCVAYLDMTGSGNETSAHLYENGRITFMFCSFGPKTDIVRLYGHGRTVLKDTAEWDGLIPLFSPYPGMRQIIVADIHKVQQSCGFAVPRMELVGERDTLTRYNENKGEEYLEDYRRTRNACSQDGLVTPIGLSNG